MSSVLSTFAQKLNISSPKSHRPRTSRKASLPILARTDSIESHSLGTSVQAVDPPSELRSSNIPEGSFPGPLPQFVDRGGASPSIVYSSASCPSLTDLSTPNSSLLTNRTGSSLSGTSDGFLSFSHNAFTLFDNSSPSPSPDFAAEEVTLAQRRGVKRLFSLRSSHNPNLTDRLSPPRLKSSFSSLSPLSPRFAFNLLRRSDLNSTDDKSRMDCNEDVFDPFSRASPSVFRSDDGKPSHEPIVNSRLSRLESSSETHDPEIQARSPLNDLSVYLYRPPQAHADTPSKVKSRLHIWVSGIEPQSPTTGINLAAQTAAQPRVPPRGPRRKNRRPKLRPLVLPNRGTLREIVNPQQESIASSACPSAVPQQDAPHRALHQTASSNPVSLSADTVLGFEHGRPITSTLPPPELVTSTDVFPVALGSEHARRLSRESISEPVIVRGDGDGNVVVAPQQIEGLSQPQCHCSVPVLHESGRPSQDRYQEGPPQLKHEGETARVTLQHRRNCDKPLPRDPLDKPLPQVPPEARLDGLISLLHQAGVIADSAQSLRALALACGSGHVACPSVYPKMLLKGSASTDLRRALLEAVNDKAGQAHFVRRSSSLWSIATPWAYAL